MKIVASGVGVGRSIKMNERIEELAKEAGLKVNPDGEIGPAFFGSVDAGYRKFAELIREDMHRKVIASILITDVIMEEKGKVPNSEDYIL